MVLFYCRIGKRVSKLHINFKHGHRPYQNVRMLEIAKVNTEIRYTRECTKWQERLLNATQAWMKYINADSKDLFRLWTPQVAAP